MDIALGHPTGLHYPRVLKLLDPGINAIDSYYLKMKCISKRVVSWYQGLVQVRKGQLADNCNHNINIGVGPLILLYLFQM